MCIQMHQNSPKKCRVIPYLDDKTLEKYQNEFTFQKAGQGLFYTGALFNHRYHFVYDCGSGLSASPSTSFKSVIQCYVNNARLISNPHEIDFLVISHFHLDHINGIVELAKNTKIKKIYVPFDNPDIILLQMLYRQPSSKFQKVLKAYYALRKIMSNSESEGENRVEVIESTKEFSIFHDENQMDQSEPTVGWKFVFVNSDVNQNIVKNLQVQISSMTKGLSLEKYLSIRGNTLKSIPSKELGENPNHTSLMLMHYPIGWSYNKMDLLSATRYCVPNCCTYKCAACNRCQPNSKMIATLLSGDGGVTSNICQKFKKLISADSIDLSVFQIPHHGAENEWKQTDTQTFLSKESIPFCVCPFGIGNKYGHPSACVVCDLQGNNSLFAATQLHEFRYSIEL